MRPMAESVLPRSSEKTLPDYHYNVLSGPESIRLLHIQPGASSDPIHGFIEEARLDSSIQYCALSYAWGEPVDNKTLLLSDNATLVSRCTDTQTNVGEEEESLSELSITESLHEALLHVRRKDIVIVLWADAICIDQKNLAERSSQVMIMSKIYTQALCVLIWLGQENTDSEIAFDWLYHGYNNIVKIWSEDQNLSRFPAELSCRDCQAAFFRTFTGSTECRQWWRRRWVIQELAFARNAIFMCGSRTIDLGSLEIVANTARAIYEHMQEGAGGGLENALTLSITFRNVYMFMFFRQQIQNREMMHTKEILESIDDLQVGDLRDNLYAILSLRDPGCTTIIPDYLKNVIEVYADATLAMISESQNLKALCMLRVVDSGSLQLLDALKKESNPNTPSWIADIGNSRDSSERTRSRYYSADKGSKCSWSLSTCGTCLILEVDGIESDEIELVGSKQFDKGKSNDSEVYFRGRVDTNVLMEDLWQRDRKSLLRTIFWDCADGYDIEVMARRREMRLSEEMLRARTEEVDSWLSHHRNRPDIGEFCEISGFQAAGIPWTEDFLSTVLLGIYAVQVIGEPGWRFCRFTSGRLGWVPDAARPGDRVCILFGSPVPFVLRPVPTVQIPGHAESYLHATIVGYAYVHGIMDGELVTEVNLRESKKICLH